MTYPQFKNALESVSKRLNWQVKLAYATISEKGMSEEDNPLCGQKKNENRVMRLDEALQLQSVARK